MLYELKNWKLMFIGTDEGYMSAVYPDGIDNEFKFQYVYNHTDHLGNIRQNITKENGQLTVLREHNYYPFGLLHRSYNEEKEDLKYDKEQDFIFTVQAQAGRYKYKFQGQERQEDLNLGWDSFKYRNYDYAIGRFFNVDPLAEKFPYMTVYQFAGNKPVWSPEIEGLESGVDVWMRVRDEEILNNDNNNNSDSSNQNSDSGNNNSTQNAENNSSGDSNSSTGSSNVNNTDNNNQDSHIVSSPGTTQELPVGTVTNGGVELPQNFGTWNTPGSDGRYWIGCMACHAPNGAYRTLAYDSPSAEAGRAIAFLLSGAFLEKSITAAFRALYRAFSSSPASELFTVTTQTKSKINIIVNRGRAGEFYQRLNPNWNGRIPARGYESFETASGTHVRLAPPSRSNSGMATIKIISRKKEYQVILRFKDGL